MAGLLGLLPAHHAHHIGPSAARVIFHAVEQPTRQTSDNNVRVTMWFMVCERRDAFGLSGGPAGHPATHEAPFHRIRVVVRSQAATPAINPKLTETPGWGRTG